VALLRFILSVANKSEVDETADEYWKQKSVEDEEDQRK
jgi:hypothetical protein